MGAAAGSSAEPQSSEQSLLQLACSRARCSCSSSSKPPTYTALPPTENAAAQDFKPLSYRPLGCASTPGKAVLMPCQAEPTKSHCRTACCLTALASAAGILAIAVVTVVVGLCARAGDEVCGQALSGWTHWSFDVPGSQERHAQDLAVRPISSHSDVEALSSGAIDDGDTGGDSDRFAHSPSSLLRHTSGRHAPGGSGHGDALHTSCGLAEDNVSYILPEVYRVSHVPSVEECCRKCQTFPDGTCLAWTWGSGCTETGCKRTCVLKGAANYKDDHITKVVVPGVVSGRYQSKSEEVPMLALKSQPDTLFCFALVRPNGSERSLMRLQFERHWGIFECEGQSLYSSIVFEVAPGVKTAQVDSDLECEKGGEFKTALNSWIFIAVWNQVLIEGKFSEHDWTVKVDPDAVWFPDRLRIRLQEHRETSNGVYLNNCKFGLHGPLEVLSRNAVSVYTADLKKGDEAVCVSQQEFGGWGEDMFLDQCLLRHLSVERDNDFDLLCEDHCSCPEWISCSDSRRVAFHPFKSEEDFLTCVANAKG